MTTTRIALVCSAERSVLGWLEGRRGAHVNRRFLADHFEPEWHGDAKTLTRSGFYDNARDGEMLICPRCGSAIVAGLEGQAMEATIADDLRLVCGYFELPDGRERAPRQKGE